ncbi:hypothetical protein KBJ94_27855 [Pseudomonas sp. ITA]|uniref:hypothetical protein n=1 Tax=Pseudomonas sp. ITA TaxID=2825841 RepID=UPI002496B21C|nr:hypothetical protein [Pseudomonas sp. ITA]MDI2145864.1 hypothetical protein [Pseudomonas sp. ITA]
MSLSYEWCVAVLLGGLLVSGCTLQAPQEGQYSDGLLSYRSTQLSLPLSGGGNTKRLWPGIITSTPPSREAVNQPEEACLCDGPPGSLTVKIVHKNFGQELKKRRGPTTAKDFMTATAAWDRQSVLLQ